MKKWVFLILIYVVSLLGVWIYRSIKCNNEVEEIITRYERGGPVKSLLMDFGYSLGIYATEQVVKEDLGALRFHINYLARGDKNILGIMVVGKDGTVLLSTDVTQEGEPAIDILGYDPMEVGKLAVEEKDDRFVVHIPLIKFNTKIGYLRIEYRK